MGLLERGLGLICDRFRADPCKSKMGVSINSDPSFWKSKKKDHVLLGPFFFRNCVQISSPSGWSHESGDM